MYKGLKRTTKKRNGYKKEKMERINENIKDIN